MTSLEIKEDAKRHWERIHGVGLDALFEEVYDAEFRQEIENAQHPAYRSVLCSKRFEQFAVARRARATRDLLNKKQAMRDQFVLSGGSEAEFERQWPELRRELLRDEAKAQKSARQEATAEHYRRMF